MTTFADWVDTTPNAPALIVDGDVTTFAELDADANRLARTLRRHGLEIGDAVALVATNHTAFAVTVLACQRAGYRLTPVNWHLTADEAAYIVDDCEAKALVTTAAVSEMAAGCFAAAPRCTVGLVAGGEIDGFVRFEGALAAESPDPVSDPAPGTSMLYTSGTTGRPKGVHRRMRPASALAASNTFGYAEAGGDVHLCTGPLYHAAPLAFSLTIPLSFGAAVVLMDHWDASEALRLIDEHQVTHTHMVPTMFHRLLGLADDERERFDGSSLRNVLHGAAPCPVPIKRAIIEWFGPVVHEYYAATEGVGSLVDSQTWLAHPGTVGRPMVEGQVIIGDDDGTALPPGELGTVYIRAPETNRFEYFNDADKTAGAYRGDYFTLGDVGYIDDDGFLYLTDRSANLIISGGVNIYPAEVDSVLLEHDAVGDVAVIGVPDDEWGESVVAVVELKETVVARDALADELSEFCRSRLAHYKCPRRIEFVDELPREDNGKIYKRRLRDQFRERTPTTETTGAGSAPGGARDR